MIIVPGAGRVPNQVMLVGEAPGISEAHHKPPMPFVGRSGIEQDWYLSRHNLLARAWYRTNVMKLYRDGNPNPSPADIEEWTPVLQEEVERCNPQLVLTVGRYSTQWFLGDVATMDMTHGLPHRPGAFDPSRVSRAPQGCVIVPVTHPASVFHGSDDKKNDIRALVDWDYAQAARILKQIKSLRCESTHGTITDCGIDFRDDEYPNPHYADVSGQFISDYIAAKITLGGVQSMGLDTEGAPSAEWSIQVSLDPGEGFLLRRAREDFHVGIAALQEAVDRGILVITHDASTPVGCCYDTIMCRGMGLELSRANMFNTMTALYLLRFEPQGLKPAAWRWCGMRMANYESIIGDIGRGKQIDYLGRVMSHPEWPVIEPRMVHEHNGTSRVYKPHGVEQCARSILTDVANNKLDKDGNPPDPMKRWKQVLPEIRKVTAMELGPMPTGTLDDIPLHDAVAYGCKDSDATLRLYYALRKELTRRDLYSGG